MSEYGIYAGFRGPRTPGATLAESLRADLEAAFGIEFFCDTDGRYPSFAWGATSTG